MADALGAQFVMLADNLWELKLGGRSTRIANDIMEFDNPVILELAGMKPIVYQLLREHNLRVPEHRVFDLDALPAAYDFLARHPEGCAVKPANGTSSGVGVSTHLQTAAEVRRAAVLASLYDRDILIEQMIAGECYRVLVLNGTVVHAVCRRGIRLLGDGASTIAQLLDAESARRLAAGVPGLFADRDSALTLNAQGLTLASVPEAGRTLLVKSVGTVHGAGQTAEVRTVYSEDVTDHICPAVRLAAEQAAGIIGSNLLGVDFILLDPSSPLEQTGGVINEVNTTPGMHHHYDSQRERFPQAALQAARVLLGLSAESERGKPHTRADADPSTASGRLVSNCREGRLADV
ncbi:MAG: hypothetical protein AB1515_00300 [Nitrospirota bacterium]